MKKIKTIINSHPSSIQADIDEFIGANKGIDILSVSGYSYADNVMVTFILYDEPRKSETEEKVHPKPYQINS